MNDRAERVCGRAAASGEVGASRERERLRKTFWKENWRLAPSRGRPLLANRALGEDGGEGNDSPLGRPSEGAEAAGPPTKWIWPSFRGEMSWEPSAPW